MSASMTVLTTLDPVEGFNFVVLEESGAALIRRRVFLPALEAEREAHAPDAAARGALTLGNYAFAPNGATDDGLMRIDIHARRKDTLLIDGSILVTQAEGDLVRLEGLLVKKPSLWTRRVEVTRSYARIVGARVPVAMASVADVLIVGRSTFRMTYDYESINGQSVR